jgi:hypothetical protein
MHLLVLGHIGENRIFPGRVAKCQWSDRGDLRGVTCWSPKRQEDWESRFLSRARGSIFQWWMSREFERQEMFPGKNSGQWKSKNASDQTVSLIIAPTKRSYAAFAASAEPWCFERLDNHPGSVRLSRFIRLTACARFFLQVLTIFLDQTTIAECLLIWPTICLNDLFLADLTITNQNSNPDGIARDWKWNDTIWRRLLLL